MNTVVSDTEQNSLKPLGNSVSTLSDMKKEKDVDPWYVSDNIEEKNTLPVVIAETILEEEEIYLIYISTENVEFENEIDDIILDGPEKNSRSSIIYDEILDPFPNFYSILERITAPLKNMLNIINDEIPHRRSNLLASHTKAIKIKPGKDSKASEPPNPPLCNGIMPYFPCSGSNCGSGNNIGLNGCLPGMPNCILTPVFPMQQTQASGIMYLPKDCPTDAPNCNSVSQNRQSPAPPSYVVTVSPVIQQQSHSVPNTIPLPPATVELKLEPRINDPIPECCSSSCKDDEKCIIYHGKKYRLVPYESSLCCNIKIIYILLAGSECSDFVDPSSIIQRIIPVPENCISTLKDMDFSSETWRQPQPCQRATFKVVINLGRSLSQLSRALNQIYNIGGCSLSPRDTKV
ncbi:hypothetical protein HZS_6598 [Henneguya salminicola]|nr:hypothetical protein HZS_6598 [Henneguya salminicola]